MKKITAAVFTLCLLLSCAMPCFAAEISGEQSSGEVNLTAQVPETHVLTVSVKNGTVSYNGKDGTRLEIPRLSAFSLAIKIDSGYRVKKITLDETDVTDAYKDGQLTLSGIYAEAQLNVVTEKIGGTYDVDNPNPKAGDKVTITPKPDEGYELDKVTVKDENGKEIEVTDNGDGTYSYIQPEGEVTIEVDFDKKAESQGNFPQTGDNNNLTLWLAMMFVSGTALVGTAVYNKRRKKYSK